MPGSRQQLLDELDRVRHECEAVQEENVRLQSECERYKNAVVELEQGSVARIQRRSASSGDAETDAGREWRIRSDHSPQRPPPTNTSDVGDGFVLPHDVEQLQERVVELERANLLLLSRHRSPTSLAGELGMSIGGFIDEKLQLEAMQTRSGLPELFVRDSPTSCVSPTFSQDDGELSPIPSPDGETHSPAYERLKAEFVAYKQKMTKDYTRLKARLVSTIREYNELKSINTLGRSPSPSPVVRSPATSVADILVLQSRVQEQLDGIAERKHSTSSRHFHEKEVQTDVYEESATDEHVVESRPSEGLQGIQGRAESGEDVQERSTGGSMLPSQQNSASVLELAGRLIEAAGKQEKPDVTAAPAAVATEDVTSADTTDIIEAAGKQEIPDVTLAPPAAVATEDVTLADTTDAASSQYRDVVAENRRLRHERKMERSDYEERLRLLEERCIEVNTKLKQRLDTVSAGSDVGIGDSLELCRHCAELAEKCRMLEMSVELSSMIAEQRLREAEESRGVAAELRRQLQELTEDDGRVVSELCDIYTCSNSLLSCVDGSSIFDDRKCVSDAVINDKTVSFVDHNTVAILDHRSVEHRSCLSGNDVDAEVAQIFELKHEKNNGCSIANSNLELHESFAGDGVSNGFSSCMDLSDRASQSYSQAGEVDNTVSLQDKHEAPHVYENCRSAVAEAGNRSQRTGSQRTDTFATVPGRQPSVTSSLGIICQESVYHYSAGRDADVTQVPHIAVSLSEETRTQTSTVNSSKSADIQTNTCSGKTSENHESSVDVVHGSTSLQKPRSLSLPNIVKSGKPPRWNYSDMPASEIVDSGEDVEKNVVESCGGPCRLASSAVVLENVAKLASQNEAMLRRNRAWTDKLKHEYAVAANELRTVKDRYETMVCEKEKVQAHLVLVQQDAASTVVAGKRTAVEREGTVREWQQEDTALPTMARDVSLEERYETSLAEKNELGARFEVERLKLLEEHGESQVGEAEMRMLQVADTGDEVPTTVVKVSDQLMEDVPLSQHAASADPGISASNVGFDDHLSVPTTHEEPCLESIFSSPTLCPGYSEESKHASSVADTVSLTVSFPSGTETDSHFDSGTGNVNLPAVGSSCEDQINIAATQTTFQTNNAITDDDVNSSDVKSTCNVLQPTPDASVELQSSVYLELELLRFEKSELCASLEVEEQKCLELQQQHCVLAGSVELLEQRSRELEGQLSDSKIQLEIVLDEKRELYRRLEELSGELEAAKLIQTEYDTLTQDQTLTPDTFIDTDMSPVDVTVIGTDISFTDDQQLALKIVELEATLECRIAEKLAAVKKLEQGEEENRRLMEKMVQLQDQLDGITRSSENALRESMNKVQQLEISNTSLTNELDALKSDCRGFQEDSSRLSDVAMSLELKLESVTHANELLSQHRDELILELKSTQQHTEVLEEENARFLASLKCADEKNERLLTESAGVRCGFESLSKENEKLSAANSAAESAKCSLEEECGKLRVELRQLELTVTETRQQYDARLQQTVDCKDEECSLLSEQLEAARLTAELNALKLHDCLKCNEQQSEQLTDAGAVIRALERQLRVKDDEIRSVTELHAAAQAAVDEAMSRLAMLQRECETTTAELLEVRAKKDRILEESTTKVEALENELTSKTLNISTMREKAVQMETASDQLLNELNSVKTALLETQNQLQEEKIHHERQVSVVKERLEQKCASLQVICDSHLDELEKMTLKCTSTELQLSALVTENSDIVQELEQVREAFQNQQSLVESLSGEYKLYVDDAEKRLAEVKSYGDDMADSLTGCRQEKRIVEEKLDQLTSEFVACKHEMAALVAEIDDFKLSNDELRSQMVESQRKEENLARELDELRTKHAESCSFLRTEVEEQKELVLKAEEDRDEMRRIHEQSCHVIDETIRKYAEVEAQLLQLRQSNDMLMTDLDKSNQRCNGVSDENERLVSENRMLVDSLSSTKAEIGLLSVDNEAAEAKTAKLLSELASLDEQLAKLNRKESILLEEIKELKDTNLQLVFKLEQSGELSEKLEDSWKHAEEMKSELDELKTAHRTLLDQQEMLAEETRLVTASRDELTATVQSERQQREQECQDLTSQIAEIQAQLCTSRDDIVSLQRQKEDADSLCKVLHDGIASCISEASRVVMATGTEVEDEDAICHEMSDNVVENLKRLQMKICRRNERLESLHSELEACHEQILSEQSLHSMDKELMLKLEEECDRLKDELGATQRQLEETEEKNSATVSFLVCQLDELKHENKRISEEHRTVSSLHSSAQQTVTVLSDEITALKSSLETKDAEMEKQLKMRESEFSTLMDNYNTVVSEKNALSDQVENLGKARLRLVCQLTRACLGRSVLKEKLAQSVAELQQSSQECSDYRRKISEMDESFSVEISQNKKLADLLQKYDNLLNEIHQSVSSISLECQTDDPDVAGSQEVETSHTECEESVLKQYSDVLHHLDLVSNCHKRLKEEQSLQQEKIAGLVLERDFLKAQASVDMSVDVSLQELQDEVARLFQVKTDLENELMRLRAENMEAKHEHDHREAEMTAEREELEQKLADLHHLLDMASQSKEALETELLCERNEFERNLAVARGESLHLAGRGEEERRKIVEQLSDAESQLAGLRDRLRTSQDERDLLQLRLRYMTRECTTKDQYLDDLRNQVAAQHSHLEEVMKEHRDTVQLLVELRLEHQLGRREQLGEFSRLEEEILRLESHIGSCGSRVGTPQTKSLISASVSCHQLSSVQSLPDDSADKTDPEPTDESDHGEASGDDVAYKALETKHFQLVQELSKLKQQLADLHEANTRLSSDNAMLKQHVESKTLSDSSSVSLFSVPEHRSSADFSRGPYRVQSCDQFFSVGSATSLASLGQQRQQVCLNIPVEMVNMQAKLVRLQKDYQELVEENSTLRTSLLAKQDELMKQMEMVRDKQKKRSFRFSSSYSSENAAAMTEVSGQQIQLLQKERDELRSRLDAGRIREDEAAKISDRVEQLEDALSRERQKFHELYQEKESIEIQLFREQLTVEKHVREFQRLHGLLSKKDRLEQQLYKTSTASSGDVTSSAGTRQLLQDKKTQLVVEIRRRILYRDVALQVGDSSLRSVRRTQSTSVQPMVKRQSAMSAERSLRLDCGCITELGSMRMRAGCRYHQAVERLRRELKLQESAARKTQPRVTSSANKDDR